MKTTDKLGDFWDSSPHLEKEFFSPSWWTWSPSTLKTHGHLWVLENASTMVEIDSGNFPPKFTLYKPPPLGRKCEDKLVMKMVEEKKNKVNPAQCMSGCGLY